MGSDSRRDWININAEELNKRLINRDKGEDKFFLLDVRNENEEEICSIPGTNKLIPVSGLEKNLSLIQDLIQNEDIIVYCKSGIRSLKACELLINNGVKNLFHLDGGILDYIKEIDPDLPVY